MELSKCCRTKLEFLVKLSSTDNKNIPFLIPEGINPPGLQYDLYRCGRCGLIYCLKPKRLKQDEVIDEWE